MLNWLFQRRRKVPCCPVCNCTNYVETPFEGRVDQGVIGFQRTFACGFATHWRGYRTALCSQPHPNPATQAIDAVTLPARKMSSVANGGSIHLAS